MYPTAAAALGLGLAPHELEEKSEATATGGASVTSGGAGGAGGSSAASTASTNNLELSNGVIRRRLAQGEGGVAVRGSSSSAGAGGVDVGGFLFIPATGGIATSGPPAVVAGAAAASAAGKREFCWVARATNGQTAGSCIS